MCGHVDQLRLESLQNAVSDAELELRLQVVAEETRDYHGYEEVQLVVDHWDVVIPLERAGEELGRILSLVSEVAESTLGRSPAWHDVMSEE